MRNFVLLLLSALMLTLVASGCTGLVPLFGGQEGEINKEKTESQNTTTFRVSNPGGTTAFAAAQADQMRMEGMAKMREADAKVAAAVAEVEAARFALLQAELRASVWRDRAIWAAIALAVVSLLFPGVAVWLWRKANKLKDALWSYRGVMTPEQVKDMDAGSRVRLV